MSSIVTGYGNPKLSAIKEMKKIVKHRGKYNFGIFQKGKSILAHNYFEADKGEEFYYFKLFIDYFGEGKKVQIVGQCDRT